VVFIVALYILKKYLNNKGEIIMRVQELINFINENKNLNEEQIKAKTAKYINTKKYNNQ